MTPEEQKEARAKLEEIYAQAQSNPQTTFLLGLQAMGQMGAQTYMDMDQQPKEVKPAFAEELFARPHEFRTISPYNNLRGFVHPRVRDFSFTNTNQKRDPMFTRHHEAEHILQNKGGMQMVDGKYDYTRGALSSAYNRNMKGRDDVYGFVKRLERISDDLGKKYPELAYLKSPEYLKDAVWNGKFDEVMADLAALERYRKLDFKNDPDFKDVFEPKGSYEAYRSISGLRNIQTDPKDIPARSLVDEENRWKGGAIREQNDKGFNLSNFLRKYLPY